MNQDQPNSRTDNTLSEATQALTESFAWILLAVPDGLPVEGSAGDTMHLPVMLSSLPEEIGPDQARVSLLGGFLLSFVEELLKDPARWTLVAPVLTLLLNRMASSVEESSREMERTLKKQVATGLPEGVSMATNSTVEVGNLPFADFKQQIADLIQPATGLFFIASSSHQDRMVNQVRTNLTAPQIRFLLECLLEDMEDTDLPETNQEMIRRAGPPAKPRVDPRLN